MIHWTEWWWDEAARSGAVESPWSQKDAPPTPETSKNQSSSQLRAECESTAVWPHQSTHAVNLHRSMLWLDPTKFYCPVVFVMVVIVHILLTTMTSVMTVRALSSYTSNAGKCWRSKPDAKCDNKAEIWVCVERNIRFARISILQASSRACAHETQRRLTGLVIALIERWQRGRRSSHVFQIICACSSWLTTVSDDLIRVNQS